MDSPNDEEPNPSPPGQPTAPREADDSRESLDSHGARDAAAGESDGESARDPGGQHGPGELREALRALPAVVHPRLRRAIVLGVLAAGAAVVARLGDPDAGEWEAKLLAYVGAVAFLLLGLGAVLSLAGEMRRVLAPRMGDSHASVVRLAIVLLGALLALLVMLGLLKLPVGQLVLGGALTGVVVGIAGQQTLANVFAGLVLLYARPFGIGDQVHVKSGPLGGEMDGRVVEIGLLYVRLECADGEFTVPNSLMQSAAVGRMEEPGGTTAEASTSKQVGS